MGNPARKRSGITFSLSSRILNARVATCDSGSMLGRQANFLFPAAA